jgi:hypothetical protein
MLFGPSNEDDWIREPSRMFAPLEKELPNASPPSRVLV